MRPQTIQICLPVGDPQGIRVAEITTRTVQVFDVPRNEIAGLFDSPESDQVAVYYLYGDESGDSRTQCYVGHTSSSRQRFEGHMATKAFLSHALVAVSRTNTQTDTHARFLEWKSIQAGNESGRFVLENGNAGSRPHTPAPLEAECEEIFDTIDTLLSTLGFPLFKPLATAAPKPTDLLVFCKGRGADTKGIYSSDGLTVFNGSRYAVRATNKATPTSLHARRVKLIDDGTLMLEGDVPVFSRDALFKTSTGASDVVMFRNANGWTEWRTEDGTKLNHATGRSAGQGEDGE